MKIFQRKKKRILELYSSMRNPRVTSSFHGEHGIVWVGNNGGSIVYEFYGTAEECLELLYEIHKKEKNNGNIDKYSRV